METRSWASPLTLFSVLLALTTASPAQAASEEELEPQVLLAQLSYTNGVQAVFNVDSRSGDFGLIQTGPVNRSGPLLRDPGSGLLAAYLSITPPSVAVPYQLLPPPGTPTPPELAKRQISSMPVVAGNLTAPVSTQASLTCWDLYFNSYNWYDVAGYPNPTSVWHDATTNYVSNFYGSMKEFSDSYVGNCGSGPVRHRVYYKEAGSYHKHHDASINSGYWQAVHKGSVIRWRKVSYDAGDGYTRNGRFHN